MGSKKTNIDFDDIIFEHRNKEYGAYPIRKGYRKRFGMSLIIASVLVFAIVWLCGRRTKEFLPVPPKQVKVVDVAIKDYRIPAPPQKKIIPKPSPQPNNKEAVNSHAEKANTVLTINNTTTKNGELIIQSVPPSNVASIEVDAPELDVKPVIKQDNTPKENNPLAHIEDLTKESASTKVQTLPHYKGGDSAWYQYLKHNLNINQILRNGAMPSVYTAVIAFIVHADSTTSDFRIVKDAGYGTGAEALRVIEKSGKWVPGTKNNKPTTFAQLQTVVFKINN